MDAGRLRRHLITPSASAHRRRAFEIENHWASAEHEPRSSTVRGIAGSVRDPWRVRSLRRARQHRRRRPTLDPEPIGPAADEGALGPVRLTDSARRDARRAS